MTRAVWEAGLSIRLTDPRSLWLVDYNRQTLGAITLKRVSERHLVLYLGV